MADATEAQLLQTVARAERNGTAAQLANALDHLAIHYHRAGAFAQAAPVYARALGIWRQILGPEHPSVGTLLLNLGRIYLHLRDLPTAEPLFRQAIGIFEGDVQLDDPGVVESLDHFLGALRAEGRHDEAERLELRVRRIASLVHEFVRV